jgi:pimeloyl-ACP methyl ester carboxylesterase
MSDEPEAHLASPHSRRQALTNEVGPAAARAVDLMAMRVLAWRLFGRHYDGHAVQRTQVDLAPYLRPELMANPLRLYPEPPQPSDVVLERAERLLDAEPRGWRLPVWSMDGDGLQAAEGELERHDFVFTSAHRSIHPDFAAQLGRTPENLRVHGRLYLAPGVSVRSAVVFAHGFADSSLDLSARFVPAARLARLGTAVAFLSLPWHGPRKPDAARFHGEYFLSADLARTLESLLQAVSDTRSVAAWLRRHLGVSRVGVMGGSLGGCVATLSAAVAPELDFLAAIAPAIRLLAGQGLSLGREIAAGITRQEASPELLDSLQRLADPCQFRPAMSTARMLFVAGRGDAFVTPAHLEALQQSWGPLDIRWHAAGHLTTMLAFPPARLFEEVERFLHRIGVG